MADEVMNDAGTDDSLGAAAAAIDMLLKKQPADDQPPADAAQQDSPQAETPEVPDTANAAIEGADLTVQDADKTADQPVQQPAKPLASSPELDQARQEAAKKVQEAETARSQYVQALNFHIPQLVAQIKGQFADIKSEDDLIALADPASPKYDVTRFNAFRAHQMRLESAQRALQGAQAQAKQEQDAKTAEWRKGEEAKIADLIPELKDQTKGPVLARKLQDFAIKSGYSREQLSMASATDFQLLHRAMQYDDLAAAQEAAKKKAAGAPPVQKPGNVQSGGNKEQKVNADFERLSRTGRTDDAAAVFRSILN